MAGVGFDARELGTLDQAENLGGDTSVPRLGREPPSNLVVTQGA
jgi:hypothetical protein